MQQVALGDRTVGGGDKGHLGSGARTGPAGIWGMGP